MPEFTGQVLKELGRYLLDNKLLYPVMSFGNFIQPESLRLSVLSQSTLDQKLRITFSVFFNSLVAGCQCADDPTPMHETAEYAELELIYLIGSAEMEVKLIQP